MKKAISILLVMTMTIVPTFSATTANLTLTGVVNGVLDITVIAEPAASNLDLLSSQTDLPVATVTEKSNKASGYTVSLESANAVATGSNAASLNGTAGNPDKLDYTLKYDGISVSFTGGSAIITDSTSTTSSSGVTKGLSMSYTANSALKEGTYEDTLTFTIAAK